MSTVQTECDLQRVRAITAFRLGREGEGSAALVKFIDCLAPALERNSDLLGGDEATLLNEIMAAQQRGDYLFVADLLEYLLPATALGGITTV